MKKIFFAFIAIITLSTGAFAQTKNTMVVTNLSPERFKAIIANDKTPQVIDLRTTDEIKSKGYIKGAIQMDYLAKDFDTKLATLDKSKPVYIYCAAGGRSGDAAEQMEKLGFTHVYNLEKGISEWISHGMPVEKK